MMCKNRSRRIVALLLGMLIYTTGCSSNNSSELSSRETISTDLPPFITSDTVSTETTEISEETETETATMEDPTYLAYVASWEFPENFGSLQEVRVYQDQVYLLSLEQTESMETKGVLFCASAEPEPVFTELFADADEENFIGLTDFDILSDGTICGLLCENTVSVPYDDPNFDEETFDWDTYYENSSVQYRLVWYNEDGRVTQKLGLSTLLDLDDTMMQTVAFTGIRCDSADRIYLTATIDDQEYLMALDQNENLCTVQGDTSEMVTLCSSYQWIRCGSDGMLLFEKNNDNAIALYHVVITDDALWKMQVQVSDLLDNMTLLAEDYLSDSWYGLWNDVGIYRCEKDGESELLYSWTNIQQSAEDVTKVILLSDLKVLMMTYSAQGELALYLVVPEEYEQIIETEPSLKPTESEDTSKVEESDHAEETVPIATDVTTLQ